VWEDSVSEMDSHSLIPEQSVNDKKCGARQFAEGQFEVAAMLYRSALYGIMSDDLQLLVWPEQELFALALFSNLALCALKLKQPDNALEHCLKAQSLSVFQVNAPEYLRQKVYARTVEAMLDCHHLEDEEPSKDRMCSHPSKEDIWVVLDDARLRGYLSEHTNVSHATRQKFLHLGARLHEGVSCHSVAENGYRSWVDRLVMTGIVPAAEGDASRERVTVFQGSDSEKEHNIYAELDALVVTKPKCISTIDLCKSMVSSVQRGETGAEAAAYLRSTLRQSNMHPCAIADEDGHGHLMWAICYGLNHSEYSNASSSMDTFLALLALLVEEFDVSINQRGTCTSASSINPLQLVVKYGHPQAVRAMLERGASVNLRDDEGWTALASICMNDIKVDNEEHWLETAQLLIDAGADVNAESTTGYTPLLALCCKPCAPLLALLLRSGANPHHLSHSGEGAIQLLNKCAAGGSEAAKRCQLILESRIINDADPGSLLQIKAVKFGYFISDVVVKTHNNFVEEHKHYVSHDNYASSRPEGRRPRAEQEVAELSAVFEYLGMDSQVLRRRFQMGDPNWLETLCNKINDMVPEEFAKVYIDQDPPDAAVQIMVSNDRDAYRAGQCTDENGVRRVDRDAAARQVLGSFRERGLRFEGLMTVLHQLVVTIQHCVSFAVPSDLLINRITHYGPVVEVGAGTGYWSAVLQSRGIDVTTYDANPPTADHASNDFFNFTYMDVLKGDATKLFESGDTSCNHDLLGKRTLLIVWPNNPDKLDNPQLLRNEEDMFPIWDADCLESYIRASGSTVVYVGERETNIEVLPGRRPECGISSSRRFQQLLLEHFTLVEEIKIPQWYLSVDDATIWQRKP
jgi:hypothetical protein